MGELKMEDNYSKAYKEVIEILNFVPKESVDKIPQRMIDTFKAKMDQNYDFKVDINKSFEEQELLDETKAIFANIFNIFFIPRLKFKKNLPHFHCSTNIVLSSEITEHIKCPLKSCIDIH